MVLKIYLGIEKYTEFGNKKEESLYVGMEQHKMCRQYGQQRDVAAGGVFFLKLAYLHQLFNVCAVCVSEREQEFQELSVSLRADGSEWMMSFHPPETSWGTSDHTITAGRADAATLQHQSS